MSRDLGTINRSKSLQEHTDVALLAEFEFGPDDSDPAHVRVWTGTGNLTVLGRTFTGLGELGQVTPLREKNAITPQNVAFRLNGIPSGMINTVLNIDYRGRMCRLWFAFMTADFTDVLDTPIQLFVGRMDTCSIEDNGATSAVVVNAESKLVDLDRPSMIRWTHEEQTRRFPGDLGLEFVSSLAERPIYWGGPGPAAQPGYGGTP